MYMFIDEYILHSKSFLEQHIFWLDFQTAGIRNDIERLATLKTDDPS